MQQKLVHRELSTFFFIPLVLPIIVMAVLMFGAQRLYSAYVYQKGIIPLYGFATITVFAILYSAYYVVTCHLFKSNIFMNKT
jgi:hypothetical protein